MANCVIQARAIEHSRIDPQITSIGKQEERISDYYSQMVSRHNSQSRDIDWKD